MRLSRKELKAAGSSLGHLGLFAGKVVRAGLRAAATFSCRSAHPVWAVKGRANKWCGLGQGEQAEPLRAVGGGRTSSAVPFVPSNVWQNSAPNGSKSYSRKVEGKRSGWWGFTMSDQRAILPAKIILLLGRVIFFEIWTGLLPRERQGFLI